jgi:hypothetical protein
LLCAPCWDTSLGAMCCGSFRWCLCQGQQAISDLEHWHECWSSDALQSACLHLSQQCRSISRDRGLRAVLEAAGSICVLFYLCWRLAPVLATVIVGTGMAAAVYRKVAKGIENKLSKSLSSLSRVAGQAFARLQVRRLQPLQQRLHCARICGCAASSHCGHTRAFCNPPPASTCATCLWRSLQGTGVHALSRAAQAAHGAVRKPHSL